MTWEQSGDGRTLVLHGGMHKTGSSAIQAYLYNHLDEPDVEYFCFDRPNSSLVLLEAFHSRLGSLPRYKARGSTPDQLAERRRKSRSRFHRRLEASCAQTVIISAESFSLLNLAECQDLEQQLRTHFSRIKLVLYIRPLYSRIESAFQQKLKKRFVPLEHKVSPNFRERIANYDAVFGQENVIIRPYQPEHFAGGSVVNDFLGIFGMEAVEQPVPRANVGLSLPAVQLLYLYRSLYPAASKEDDALVAQLSRLKGERFRLHPELLDRILVECDDGYDWLEQRVGISLYDEADRGAAQVKSEADLLAVSAATLQWLERETAGLVDANSQLKPKDIARALKAWALQLQDVDENGMAGNGVESGS